MKSFLDHAVHVYGGVFSDASARWPDLRVSFEKDLSYLRRAVEARGISLLTITFPDMGKVFDRSLARGRLVEEEIPQGFPYSRNKPKFIGDLFALVFDESRVLRSNACVDAVFFIRQILYLSKKMRLLYHTSKLEETLDEFFKIERQLPEPWADTWDSQEPTWQPRSGHPLWGPDQSSDQDDLLGRPDFNRTHLPWNDLRALARRITSGIGEPDWWSLRPKHGPGATSERRKEGLKYEFPNWPRKLEAWFPFEWFGSGLLDQVSRPNDREPPSRLIAVPKTLKGPRLICAEPVAHQWMQQAIRGWVEERINHTPLRLSINFRSQESSRERALRASIDGKYATIDLSSASDRLSCRLVEYILQGSPILDGLHACRTRLLTQDLSKKHDSFVKLRKFSTMGSAVTFPIQSIVFAVLAAWGVRLSQNKSMTNASERDLEETFREVTVFGDDIIIPTTALSAVKLVLHECGLKVNTDKTFGTGLFRESCGMDAFKGHDVTPAYILAPYDGSAESIATTVEVTNNFFHKGLWATSDRVLQQIPEEEFKLLRVCGSDDGAFGLKSFVGTSTSHLKDGYDEHLQRPYSISLAVTSKVKKERGRGTADLTQYFTEDPSPDHPWQAGQVGRVLLRKRRTRVYS